MVRIAIALFLVMSALAQQPVSNRHLNQDLPAATPEQIEQLTAKLDQMRAFIQAGQLKDAFRVNISFSSELGKLSVRVLTAEEQVLQYEQLMAQRPQTRIVFLPMAARFALDAGQLDKAEAFANELLTRTETGQPDALRGQRSHAAHILLGRVALQRTHDLVTAKAELLAATKVAPADIQRFGPNMSLSRDLLAAGERATVLEYVNSFHDLSSDVMEKLNRWAKLIQSGGIPDFGANAWFYM